MSNPNANMYGLYQPNYLGQMVTDGRLSRKTFDGYMERYNNFMRDAMNMPKAQRRLLVHGLNKAVRDELVRGRESSRYRQDYLKGQSARDAARNKAMRRQEKMDRARKSASTTQPSGDDHDRSASSEAMSGTVSLGSPDLSRLNALVDATIKSTTDQLRRENARLARQKAGDIIRNADAAYQFDRGASAIGGATRALTESQLKGNALAAQQTAAREKAIADKQLQAGVMGNVAPTLEQANMDAMTEANRAQDASLIKGSGDTTQHMANAARQASYLASQENARGIDSAYKAQINANSRALADALARRPLVSWELEKDMTDQWLKRKAAELEFAQGNESIASSKSARSLNSKQFKAQQAQQKAYEKDMINKILSGSYEDIEVPITGPDGRIYMQKQKQLVGQPESIDEAALAISNVLGPGRDKEAKAIAKKWWASRQAGVQKNISAAAAAISKPARVLDSMWPGL